MPDEAPMKPADMLQVAKSVTISPDRLSADVAGMDFSEDSPRELQKVIAGALYERFHVGREVGKIINRQLTRSLHRDIDFEMRLRKAVPHENIEVTGRVMRMPRANSDGLREVLLDRDGLRIWTPIEALHETNIRSIGQIVSLSASPCRPAVSPGFFLVQGKRHLDPDSSIVRVYTNITEHEQAPDVWAAALRRLEDVGAAFRAKILSDLPSYPRRDALVIYLESTYEAAAFDIADAVSGLPGVGATTSVYASELTAGVAMAWEPSDPRPGRHGLSFGQHRSSVLAEALMHSARTGCPIGTSLTDHLVEAGVDPGNPARNLH
ncbi:T3SS effector HopA1 family protein [Streptomyces sp. NPDC085927]|uniref:T3SS effector HopA1 family protein n=1 Tax=Streptomyces sp. NPDC085927 TaxID=3365738 RepID=UPI0037D921DD